MAKSLRRTNAIFEILDKDDLQISFDLPKGTYATALLMEMAELDERDEVAADVRRL